MDLKSQFRLLSAICAIITLAITGCGEKKPSSDSGQQAAARLKVAMVTDTGGIEDLSFNSASWAGMQRAAKDFGCEAKFLESREQADYRTNLGSLAEAGNQLVVAVGFMMEEAMAQAAKDYPDTKFAIIDGNAPALPNAVSLKFREEEGSFLAGYLAAKMSKKHAIGFVGGVDSALIKKFESGYRAGAKTADGRCQVVAKYVGSWTDLSKGNVIAQQMLDEEDILFAAAGKSGLGVLKACAEKGPGYYGIGVDADQDHLYQGRILTSMMKGVDAAVYDTIKMVKEGKWQAGERVFGIKEGGIHLSPMTYTKKDVPAPVLAQLDQLSKMIADGKFKVPKTLEEVAAFTPPKI